MANTLFKVTSSESATTAASAVNLSNTKVAQKIVDGTLNFLVKGATAIGGVCTDKSGNVYVSDSAQHVVLKINESGKISILAGVVGSSGINGTLTVTSSVARFNTPMGLACDNSGNVYVADSGNNQIRVISGGKVSVLAGNGDGTSGFVDGVGGNAKFNAPWDVAVDNSGTVYVADKSNNSIRTIKGGTVYTWAGSQSGSGENVATSTRAIFNAPRAVDVDASGNVYVCDTGNDKVKKITPNGWVYLFSGSTDGKAKGTTAYTAQYKLLTGIAVDGSGSVYIVDQNASGSRVLRLDQNGKANIISDTVNASTVDDTLLAVAVSPAQKLFVVAAS